MNFSHDSHGVHRSAVATDDVDHGQVTGNVNFGQIKAVRADKVLMLAEIKYTFQSHITVPVIEAVREHHNVNATKQTGDAGCE